MTETQPAIQWRGAPLKISNSEIQTFKSCRRKWYLTYYRELALKRESGAPVGARQLGTRVHAALEALYQDHENPITAIDALYAKDIAEYRTWEFAKEETVIEIQREQDLAHAMLEGFMQWRAEEGLDEGMELIGAEQVVEVPFPEVPGVILRGKMDQRWHRKIDGRRLFRDWKTVANLTDPVKLLPLDEQMKFYHLLEFLAARDVTGQDPQWRTDGALYTMLRKVKRTAAAKPPFYGQVEVHHNMAELRSMWFRVLKVCQEIVVTRQAMDAGGDHRYVVPPRPSRDCTWSCDFFAVCPMMDDGSNSEGLLAAYYAHLDPHERYNAQDEGREVTE